MKQRAHELSGPLSNNAERVCAQSLSACCLFLICGPTATFSIVRGGRPRPPLGSNELHGTLHNLIFKLRIIEIGSILGKG